MQPDQRLILRAHQTRQYVIFGILSRGLNTQNPIRGSVNACGMDRRRPPPSFEITICDFKFDCTAKSASNITRCPRMAKIRFSTRSSDMVIGLFSPGDRFPSSGPHEPCRRARKCERPRKGAFLHDERGSSGAVYCLSRMSVIRSAARPSPPSRTPR
jgi:hypothetical protein